MYNFSTTKLLRAHVIFFLRMVHFAVMLSLAGAAGLWGVTVHTYIFHEFLLRSVTFIGHQTFPPHTHLGVVNRYKIHQMPPISNPTKIQVNTRLCE